MSYRIVVVGTSLGGLNALEVLLGGLPAEFPLPVVVVQHRSVESGDAMLRAVQRRSALPVREPNDKEPILDGHVYIAPPDYHLMLEPGEFALSTEGPVYFARPSVDVLFESAADAYGAGVVAVILTGASGDGARGALRIKERGGLVVIQDPGTAESGVMPRAALVATQADCVLPLKEIPRLLIGLSSYAHA